ncbi:MAG: carbohydrate ABC transporter permease [Chloroflexi bacterium]|nr:carbohydrate ABC transporter permease [Chloroflexota bacterium]
MARRLVSLRQLPVYIALATMVLLCLFPLYWSLVSSLKGQAELYEATPSLIVRAPMLENYRVVLSLTGGNEIPLYLWNSLKIGLGAVLVQLVSASMAGYAFSRMQFRGRNLIFVSLVLVLFIPRVGGLMATYELMDLLHLRNSHLGLVLLFPSSISVALFVMRQAFLSVPRELEEAAMIDGANTWRVFLRIALPMVQGALVVISILMFLSTWGDFLMTYTLLDEARLFTVSIAITQITGWSTRFASDVATTYGSDNAAFILASAPVVLAYVLAQKWFVRGLQEGIIKL